MVELSSSSLPLWRVVEERAAVLVRGLAARSGFVAFSALDAGALDQVEVPAPCGSAGALLLGVRSGWRFWM